MSKRKPKIVVLVFGTILFVALLVFLLSPVHAQIGGAYELTWSTFDGGGATPPGSAGGSYELSGTIGQPDAGNASGGAYSLGGGFWGNTITFLKTYLPIVLK